MPATRRQPRADGMNDSRLVHTGVVGTVIAALCCFTPALAILTGVVGFSAVIGYLDIILLPALVFFMGLTVYAVWRRRAHKKASTEGNKTHV